MKRLSIFVYLIFLMNITASCTLIYKSEEPKLAPSIDFKNSSTDGSIVKNIKVIWNGHHLLEISQPINSCGSGGSQSHYIKDFFGPVHIEWENAKGEKLIKDFVFKKEDLPNYKNRQKPDIYSYVILYFNQTDVEYYTSDNPNIKQIKREKRGNWVSKWFEKEGVTKCVNDPKEANSLRELNKKYPNISTETGKPIDEK